MQRKSLLRPEAKETVSTTVARPVVSVVIPAFNSAWSISQTIQSVQAQTFGDFEVIVVNDGSTDDLEARLEKFRTDQRIRVVHQNNRGLAGARNRGLHEALGEFVAFLDADDIWHPRFLERVIDALRKNPGAPFGYSLMMRIDENNRLIPTPAWSRPPRHDFVGLLELNSVGNGSASVFRRDAVLAAGGFDETLRDRAAQGAEDWKLILTIAADARPVLVPEQLVAYRIVQRSMSRDRPEEQLRAIRAVMDEMRSLHADLPGRHFRNARTVMNGWILPAFLAKGLYGRAAWLLAESYLLNPLFFLSADVRKLHWHKLRSMAEGQRPRRAISEMMDADGTRPFGFIADGDIG
jgi:glycosyltransferase involved in cell wall biosynthesis